MTFRLVITLHSQTNVMYWRLTEFAPPVQPFSSGMLSRYLDAYVSDCLRGQSIDEEN